MRYRITVEKRDDNGTGGELYRDFISDDFGCVDYQALITDMLETLYNDTGNEIFDKPNESIFDESIVADLVAKDAKEMTAEEKTELIDEKLMAEADEYNRLTDEETNQQID